MKRKVHQKFGKKVLLSIAAVIALSVCKVSAQGQDPNLYVGPTAGFQYTTIVSNKQNFTGGFAYNAGISADFRINQHWGTELVLDYNTINTSTQYKDSIVFNGYTQRSKYDLKFNAAYYQAKLLFKYFIRLGGDPITPYDRPTGSGNYLFFLAGPYFQMIPSSTSGGHIGRTGTRSDQKHVNFTPNDTPAPTVTTFIADDKQEQFDETSINTNDFGFVVGAGVQLRLSSAANLNISLSYASSLTSIDIYTAGPTSGDFYLGHMDLTKVNNTAGLVYSAANASYVNIGLNVGVTFKLFGDNY